MLCSASMFIGVGAFLCWALTAKTKTPPGKPGPPEFEYNPAAAVVGAFIGLGCFLFVCWVSQKPATYSPSRYNYLTRDLPNTADAIGVGGHYRSDGTYVQPHRRSRPDGIVENNWSMSGNVNPYSGKPGTRVTASSTSNGPARSAPVVAYGPTYSPAIQAAAVSVSSASDNTSSLDASTRQAIADRLRALGVSRDWRNHSFSELQEMEVRVNIADRLRSTGVTRKWEDYSFSQLQDMEVRANIAGRLRSAGVGRKWEDYSFSQLQDMEVRANIANRLRQAGVTVNWEQASFSELQDMEVRVNIANRLKSRGVAVDWRKHSFSELQDAELRLSR